MLDIFCINIFVKKNIMNLKFTTQLIAKNRFKCAIELLLKETLTSQQSRIVVSLKSRYHTNETAKTLGVIAYEKYLLEKNKLTQSLLQLVDELLTGEVFLPFSIELKKAYAMSKLFIITYKNQQHFLEFKTTALKELLTFNNQILKSRFNCINYRSSIPFILSLKDENFSGKLEVKYNFWTAHIKEMKLIINQNIYYEN